ncbi:MAG: multicopper oxidase domain-containing protein, partial [Rhodospirillales bacterium]|nr:multicopper oxidase domain-containing protein [Rhodospirillales bacterium]
MKLNRRKLLKGAGALGLGALVQPLVASAATAPKKLIARTGRITMQAGQTKLEMPVWGYGGASPGEVLTVDQGGVLDLNLKNELPEETSIHWHGIRTPNNMDGVPFVTQKAVQPGGDFQYRFTCEDAGTYWYHPHANS